MQKAKRTPWGEAVAWAIADLLSRTGDVDEWHYFQRPAEAGFGFLHPAFAPYFPGWKRMFREAEVEFRSGWYVFKAVIEPKWCAPAWRRLVAPGTFSLHSLATAVLKAFEFYDLDHLYEFRFQDHLGKARRYYHPECDEGPWASEITLEESGLAERQIMKFRFDFGDDWRFRLLLERIDPSGGAADIQVIGAEGPSPKQYPACE